MGKELKIIPSGSKKLETMDVYLNYLRKDKSLRVEKNITEKGNVFEVYYDRNDMRVGSIFGDGKYYEVSFCDDKVIHSVTDVDGDNIPDNYTKYKYKIGEIYEYENSENAGKKLQTEEQKIEGDN